MQPLTGAAAAESLQLCFQLEGKRFDGARVLAALRSRGGRVRLGGALIEARVRFRRALGQMRPAAGSRARAPRRRGARQGRARAGGPSEGPQPPPQAASDALGAPAGAS